MKLTPISPAYTPIGIWSYSVTGCTGATLTFFYRVPLDKNSLISSLSKKYYDTTSDVIATIPVVTQVGNNCYLSFNTQVNKDVAYRDVICKLPDNLKPDSYFYGYISYNQKICPLQITQTGDVISLFNETIPTNGWIIVSAVYVCI